MFSHLRTLALRNRSPSFSHSHDRCAGWGGGGGGEWEAMLATAGGTFENIVELLSGRVFLRMRGKPAMYTTRES